MEREREREREGTNGGSRRPRRYPGELRLRTLTPGLPGLRCSLQASWRWDSRIDKRRKQASPLALLRRAVVAAHHRLLADRVTTRGEALVEELAVGPRAVLLQLVDVLHDESARKRCVAERAQRSEGLAARPETLPQQILLVLEQVAEPTQVLAREPALQAASKDCASKLNLGHGPWDHGAENARRPNV